MPAYTFKITHHDRELCHESTMELPDIQEAWREATLTAGHALKDIDGALSPKTEWAIEISDERRKPIRTLRISTEAHDE